MQYITGETLLAAIDEAEAGPIPGGLEGAPTIENWFLIWRDGDHVRADGNVHGHPTIDDPWITTSPVIAYEYDFEKQVGWLRSISRWYRLGKLREVFVEGEQAEQVLREALVGANNQLERQRHEWRESYGPIS